MAKDEIADSIRVRNNKVTRSKAEIKESLEVYWKLGEEIELKGHQHGPMVGWQIK